MMENNDIVSLKVDKELVSKVLNKQIQAAIVAQLGNERQLIEQAVRIALSEKVNSDGRKDQYSSYNTHDFLEVLASKSIREAANAALREWLDANSELVKKAVLAELKKPNRQRSIAAAYADAIENSLKCNWNMSCNISFKEADH
jgi:hypothetical protein